MIVSAHQPSFIPWLGLLNKIGNSQKFCVVDDVQFTRKDYITRSKIKTESGPLWLSVPVFATNHFEVAIADVKIDYSKPWQKKHLKTLKYAYSKAPHFEEFFPKVEAMYFDQPDTILELDNRWLDFALLVSEINVPIFHSSSYQILEKKSDYVLKLASSLGATKYLFGGLGRNYAEISKFHDLGIEVEFQDFRDLFYPQLHGAFVSRLGFLDALFNVGPTLPILVRTCATFSDR